MAKFQKSGPDWAGLVGWVGPSTDLFLSEIMTIYCHLRVPYLGLHSEGWISLSCNVTQLDVILVHTLICPKCRDVSNSYYPTFEKFVFVHY